MIEIDYRQESFLKKYDHIIIGYLSTYELDFINAIKDYIQILNYMK